MRSAIVGALPITAKMLADDCNIQLHFGSHTFQAGVDENGTKHLYIPNLPMDDARAEAMGLGGIVHEDAHFNFTDFNEVALAKSEHEVGEYTNVLEDIRAERLECQKYVGAARILEKMTSAAIKEGFYRPIALSMGSLALMGYALYRNRVEYLGHTALESLVLEGAELLREAIGAETFNKFDSLILEVDRCKSTRDVRLLAEEIVAMLRQSSELENGDTGEQEQQDSSTDETGQSESHEQQQDAPEDPDGDQSAPSPEDDSAAPEDSDGGSSEESNPEQGNSRSSEGGDAEEQELQDSVGDEPAQSGSHEQQQNAPGNAGGAQATLSTEDEPPAQGESDEGGGGDSNPEQGASSRSDEEYGQGEAGSTESSNAADGQEAHHGDVADKPQGGSSKSSGEVCNQPMQSGSETEEAETPIQGDASSSEDHLDAGDRTVMPSAQAPEREGDKRGTLRALLANQDLQSGAFDIGNLLEAYMDSASSEAEQVRLPDVHRADRQVGNVEAILDRIRGETAAIRRMTQGLLEATARNRYCLGKTGKDVDPTQLWKLRCGDTRVFEKRIEGKKQDTSLLILLDNSISMQNQIGIVMDAGLAIALAMESIPGISTCVAAFPYQGKESRDDVLLVSDFGEPLRHTAERFPAVVVQGTTPMAEALLWSSYHILQTRQQRKIICVVTDGQPDNLAATEEVIEALGVAGVEVMALGINTVVNQLFDTSETICNVQDVGPALFHMLQEKLAKAA